jgi:hypothetical protein
VDDLASYVEEAPELGPDELDRYDRAFSYYA